MATIQKSRTVHVNQTEDIARIREKYYGLLHDGFTTSEAAAIAEGRAPMPKKLPPKARARDFAADHEPASETITLPGTSKKNTGSASSPNIPPGWEDLSWPKLQKLATSLDNSVPVTSRKQANQIILSNLVDVSGDDEE